MGEVGRSSGGAIAVQKEKSLMDKRMWGGAIVRKIKLS